MGVNGIYGLSGSGLDIESLVKVGMMSKQNEYDKMAQKYTKNEWTKTALLDLSSQITTFNMSSLTDYKLSTTMNAKTTKSSDETSVMATASASTPLMTHKVTVTELSHNAYLIGNNAISNVIAQLRTDKTADSDEIKALADSSAIKSLASEAKLSDVLFKDLKYGNVTVTSNYNPIPTTDGNTSTYSPSEAKTKTSLLITRDVSGNISSISYKGAGNNDTSRTYSGGTITTEEKNTKTTTYTDSNYPSNTLVLTETQNLNTTNGITTSNTTTYRISINGTEKEYTLDHNNNRDKYVSTDGTSTIRIFRDGSIGIDAYSANTNYGNATTLNSSTKTETLNYKSSGGPKVTIKSVDDTVTSVVAEKTESGVTGSTFGGTYINSGYSKGQVPLTQKDDIAIAFTISDGTKTSEEISFTYGQLLGDDDNKPITMTDLAAEIRTKASAAGLDIRAEYDTLNERFSIYNSNGNNESAVIITPKGSNTNDNGALTRTNSVTTSFLSALDLKQFNGTELKALDTIDSSYGANSFGAWGGNGTINVDGIDYATKDNKVTVGGVTYTASNLTKDVNGRTVAATVTVGQDVDGIVDKVKSFVESYNKILGDLYDKYNEKPESGYSPLTQSQKDTMKDEQVEKWEEKAKKGLLYHDQTLYKIINNMRNAITNEVEGLNSKYNSAYSIGISTTGIYGQLKLDEDKLKAALAEDSDAAYNVFGKLVTTTDSTGKNVTDTAKSGVAQRLGDVFASATKSIRTRAGSSADITEDSDLNNLLRELQTKMSNFKKLMSAFEDKLYKKYDAMEVALSKLGSQLNFITGGQ